MSSSAKVVVSSIVVVVLLAVAIAWISPTLFSHPQHAHAAAASLPYNATANGPYSVSGNKILGANGQQYIFHGVARDGFEYNCSGEGPLDQQHLAFMGSGTNGANATYWGANTVRLPLSEGFWLKGAPGYPCTAAQYQANVKQVVDTLTSLHLNVMIDLQWSDAAGQSGQGGGPWQMPDADSVTFWQQVAPIYKGYSNVLFEAFNEPHPASWSCWSGGCTISNDSEYSDDCHCTKTFSYTGVGMQTLVTTIRNAGANNLIIAGGMNWGFDLSQLNTYKLSGSNIVYDTHPYTYADKQPNTWDNAFGIPSATYPVISAESGEYDCGTSFLSQLLPYFDAHQIGWVAFAWSTQGNACTYPLLVSDYNGTPTASSGQYIYQHLHSYAPSSIPPAPAPVSATWYFAEGHVGNSFNEFLTIENPDPSNDCPVTIQYFPVGGNTITKSVTVGHSSRWTESVNNDLQISPSQSTGADVSTIVTANTQGSCKGVVAERPIYFSWHGISSGGDVMGATHLGNKYYFADVPTSGGFTSFLTVFNPPSSGAATVTATYYAGGKSLESKNITLQSGQRSNFTPSSDGLPAHVSAIITSMQPILVERPDYFGNVNGGSAGTVSGGATVVGSQTLAKDWLFAEGYTANHFQEYLVIANLDTAANATTNVTVNLQLGDGTTRSYNLLVATMSQFIWNVNENMPPNTVSAEVTSSNAGIIVQREMFFQYSHTLAGSNGFTVNATGGTDVIGQVGPANTNSYTFAEGYSNIGYNEYLTLQNPTGADETVSITLSNGYGQSYVYPNGYLIRAHSRSTVDVSALVRQYLFAAGSDAGKACSVSMTVQAASGVIFVAERPQYWNTSAGGTQGGSDVLGYAGG